MNLEMDAALALKVKEQQEKMARFEREATAEVELDKKTIVEERSKISNKREMMENEIKTFMETNKVQMSQYHSLSTQSLDQSKKNIMSGFKLNIFN